MFIRQFFISECGIELFCADVIRLDFKTVTGDVVVLLHISKEGFSESLASEAFADIQLLNPYNDASRFERKRLCSDRISCLFDFVFKNENFDIFVLAHKLVKAVFMNFHWNGMTDHVRWIQFFCKRH